MYAHRAPKNSACEHVKTVELVVQRRSREGETECVGSRVPARTFQETGSVSSNGAGGSRTRRVALRIGWRERELQQRVKSAGGQWDPDRRVWYLRRDVAERLDLLLRVVGGGGAAGHEMPRCRKPEVVSRSGKLEVGDA